MCETIAGPSDRAGLTDAPELWHQKAYLASVVSLDGSAGPRDEGIQPLTHFLDAGGSDAIAMTIEADGSGAIFPVVYLRRGGQTEEHALDPDPLHDYEAPAYRKAVGQLLERLSPSVPAT